jgi:hypothetical protein
MSTIFKSSSPAATAPSAAPPGPDGRETPSPLHHVEVLWPRIP